MVLEKFHQLVDRNSPAVCRKYIPLTHGSLGTNFSEILIEIITFSFTKMRLKVSSAKRRPFCLGLNVLMRFIDRPAKAMFDIGVSTTTHNQSIYTQLARWNLVGEEWMFTLMAQLTISHSVGAVDSLVPRQQKAISKARDNEWNCLYRIS